MKLFGLIGYPLSHSFSKKYFAEKFAKEGIEGVEYDLFPIENIQALPQLIEKNSNLRGLNVTIPHKQAIIPLLDRLDPSAARIGAVNVVKITPQGEKIGYNSDYFGFKESLLHWFTHLHRDAGEAKLRNTKALILGTGGASKAVKVALDDLHVQSLFVSRQASEEGLTYQQVDKNILSTYKLIVNTTPLGMYPKVEACPPLPYSYLDSTYYLYDLVYNPEETTFIKYGTKAGSHTINGIPMLYAQAEKSWEIWNSEE